MRETLTEGLRDYLIKRPLPLRVSVIVSTLPAYGHDLNPAEPVWGNLKSKELANFCPDTIEEAAVVADQGLCRIGADTDLCFAFLRYTGLKL